MPVSRPPMIGRSSMLYSAGRIFAIFRRAESCGATILRDQNGARTFGAKLKGMYCMRVDACMDQSVSEFRPSATVVPSRARRTGFQGHEAPRGGRPRPGHGERPSSGAEIARLDKVLASWIPRSRGLQRLC
jgi:hypothetical protein